MAGENLGWDDIEKFLGGAAKQASRRVAQGILDKIMGDEEAPAEQDFSPSGSNVAQVLEMLKGMKGGAGNQSNARGGIYGIPYVGTAVRLAKAYGEAMEIKGKFEMVGLVKDALPDGGTKAYIHLAQNDVIPFITEYRELLEPLKDFIVGLIPSGKGKGKGDGDLAKYLMENLG